MEILERPPVIHVRTPEEKLKRDRKFWQWIIELDRREDEFTKKNPEKKNAIVLADESIMRALPPVPKALSGKRNVILREVGKDGFSVLLDGVCESFFFGANAHTRAIRRVNELLNEKF